LRVDFWFSCAYCTLTEVEAQGVAFHIDHYVPLKVDSALKNTYANLMYACEPCNLAKKEYYPPNQAAVDAGYRLFKADEENHADHFYVTQDLAAGTTKVGEFTTEVLRLNRLLMKRVRRARRHITTDEASIISGIHALRRMSIQSLPLELRGQFLKIKSQLEANAAALIVDDEVWAELTRSKLLDEDPDHAQLLETRRWALAQVQALTPMPAKLKPPKKS
jgi:hypothetical protein